MINGLNDIRSIESGGLHSLAIKSDGSLYVWGWGEGGQLGLPLS